MAAGSPSLLAERRPFKVLILLRKSELFYHPVENLLVCLNWLNLLFLSGGAIFIGGALNFTRFAQLELR